MNSFFYFRRRLVCKYDNVTSILNAEELGPINKGCPYMTKRRKTINSELSGMLFRSLFIEIFIPKRCMKTLIINNKVYKIKLLDYFH